MNVVIFDLDNTLYNEMSYVLSGFRAVSGFLARYLNLSESLIFSQLKKNLDREGRGRVFNSFLSSQGIFDETLVYTLIAVYRNHIPNISLGANTLEMLKEIKAMNLKLGMITDGDSTLQLRKIQALGLESYFDFILHTDILGKKHWKPSFVPFEVILQVMGFEAGEALYVGDKVDLDIVPAQFLGIEAVLFTKYFNDEKPLNVKSFASHTELLRYIISKV